MGRQPVAAPRKVAPWPWVAGIALLVLAVAVVVIPRMTSNPTPPPGVTTPVAGGGAPPDITSMTPRERALRLFDRIAEAADRGDTSQVTFFAPMALQAYEALGTADIDVFYDTGMILALSGQSDEALVKADSLEGRVPGHLLGTVIRAVVAERAGDETELNEQYRVFLDNYAAEIAISRPEYQAHRTTIDEFRARARAALGEQ